MRRSLVTAASLLVILGSRVRAQQARAAGADTAWPAAVGCTIPPDTARMRIALPLDLLDRLRAMSSSAFVHAFLIQLVADSSSGSHRVTRCAQAFLNTSPADLRRLRGNVPRAPDILEALRTAALTRQQLLPIADSARTISAVVRRLHSDPSPANMDVLGSICRTPPPVTPSPVCTLIGPMLRQADTLRLARESFTREVDRARQASAALANQTLAVQAAAAKLAADSSVLRHLDSTRTADTAAVNDVVGRLATWQKAFDTLKTRRDTLAHADSQASVAQRAAADSVARAARVLDAAVTAVEQRIDAIPALRNEADVVRRGLDADIQVPQLAAPAPLSGTPNTAVPPANVMMELTDFIIARGRRELVNTFVVNLHAAIRQSPLLQSGFPETWALMRGIRTRPDGELNAVDVGRIPLNTWRATLSGDFVSLPINLVERGPLTICSDSVLSDAAKRGACRQRVEMLAPMAPFARRLVQGGSVLDILRDAPTFTLPTAPDLPAEWQRIPQGLTVVAALADAFAAQGSVSLADVTQHPYILTAKSVGQVLPAQRAAFLRLLVVGAVRSATEAPGTVREAELYSAITAGTRAFDRIVSAAATEDEHTRTVQIVRASFEAFGDAVDIARGLTDGSAAPTLDEVQRRWRALSSAVDPLVAGDFGLALSRTTVMLRDVLDSDIPGSVVTLAALGSSLSEAHDADQVRIAFETAASPVGGWQSKRYGEGGVSVTAFPGVGTGGEMVLKHKGDAGQIGDPALTFGVALPVGIEWTFRKRDPVSTSAAPCHWVCGSGLFFPIVDLGALLSYRVAGPGDVSPEPNATFQQVFAPGVYYSMAFTRRLPLNLLLGGQLMPSLRKIEEPSGTQKRSAFRVGASLGMDLSLFSF